MRRYIVTGWDSSIQGKIVTVYPVGYIFTGELLPGGDTFSYAIHPPRIHYTGKIYPAG